MKLTKKKYEQTHLLYNIFLIWDEKVWYSLIGKSMINILGWQTHRKSITLRVGAKLLGINNNENNLNIRKDSSMNY